MEQYRTKSRLARKQRIRRKIKGDSVRPRLTVFKSLKHLYAQIINDAEGKTLASASTLSKDFKGKMKSAKNIAAAKLLGEIIADMAIEKGVKKLVFDRSGYIYHGKIAVVVDKVREKGIAI